MATKHRSTKGGTVTRRIKELQGAVQNRIPANEMKGKIQKLKDAMEELGVAQDAVIDSITDDDDKEKNIEEAEGWYYAYDDRVNQVVRLAFTSMTEQEENKKAGSTVKIQKLQVPKFDSSPTSYYKWKLTFERYMKQFDDETKYDYLFSLTDGVAHEYVMNRSNYKEAIALLDEKFGNKHLILKLMIDEIRSIPIVKRGDCNAFEKFSFKVTNFRDRLLEMEFYDEVENSYILQEMESKLGVDDLQKWFTSLTDVDHRKVSEFVNWLGNQSHIRKLTQIATLGSSEAGYKTGSFEHTGTFSERYRKGGGYTKLLSNPVAENSETVNCIICKGNHIELSVCPLFPLISFNEKWNVVKSMGVCFICLKTGHQRTDCAESKCDLCWRPHHRLLHNPRRMPGDTDQSLDPNATPYNSNNVLLTGKHEAKVTCGAIKKNEPPSRSFLPIVNMHLRNGSLTHSCKALIDSGSEINILSLKSSNRLKLKGEPVMISIVGAGGVVTRKFTKKVELMVVEDSGLETQIECIVLDEACGKVSAMGKEIFEKFKDYDISRNTISDGETEVDVLIGMSSPQFHKRKIVKGEPNGLTLIETPFGYCVVGPVPKDTNGNYLDAPVLSNHITVEGDDVKDENAFKFLEAEMAGVSKECPCSTKTDDELRFQKVMETSWTKGEDGRLEVRLPWKIDPNSLENNRVQATSRDIKIRTQLSKRKEVMQLFEEQIDEMVKEDVLIKVDANYPKRYLPLLAIVNLDRQSTKVRICLDAKSKYKGVSLNDALLKGTFEMNDIFQVLSRFRAGKNALLGDIKKMFWQIKLNSEDVKFHGIVWKGETYVFSRVCFGDKNSPPIADYSMKLIAYEGRETHPHASGVLIDKRYMDDIVDANPVEEEIRCTKEETDQLLGAFGFRIKEWFSNNSELGTVKSNNKVLGLRWNAESDALSVDINEVTEESHRCTKRIVLSKLASLWDPLGLCAAFVVKGRLIFQSIVRLKSSWDEAIKDAELVLKWESWISQLADCKDIVIGRDLFPDKPMQHCSLIGFGDGSSVAFGSALYLRWCNDDESEIEVKFVAAKGKVGPITGNTVPRMELCGALLLSRLAYSAMKAFEKSQIGQVLDSTILCSDSSTVLSWINSEAIRYRPYVKNKIIEIQDLHPVKVWRFIPTKKNRAADVISKGCDVKDLKIVIEGPDILKKSVENWPVMSKSVATQDEREEGEEKEELVVVNNVVTENELLDLRRFSDWNKLLRVTAYVMRTFKEVKKDGPKSEELRNPDHEEIRLAKNYWIQEAQKQLKDVPVKKIEKLAPFEDDEKIIRISGRLKNSTIFDKEKIHPKLLSADHYISKLIVLDIHDKTYHPGHLRVMYECRREYWIIGLRKLAKSIGRNCVICRWWRRLPLTQIMSDLPSFRITPGSPFENVAVDYFGPFEIRFGRKQRIKAYGSIFTCLTTRSVHLELVTDLTTDRFLMALRRFISFYGQPKFVRSDNGKNFIGAAAELKKMLNQWRTNYQDKKAFVDFCAKYAIKWTFSTPLASHHNGAVESLIKSVKNALNKVVKNKVLTEEEYRTVLCEVNTCINSRPLWPSCAGDLEQPSITCNDLLRPGGLERNPLPMNISDNLKKRYQFIQRVVEEWWQLWMTYFVPNLQFRSKWFKKRDNLSIGDVVLIVNPPLPRAHWKLAIVENVFPGKDGYVRSAQVKSSEGSYMRPISKLVLLLSKDEIEEFNSK